MMPRLKVGLPTLHTGQRRVADDPSRFQVLACGRRWGKTRLGAALCIEVALRGGRAWWVAPSYPMAMVGWRLVKRLGQQIPGANVRLVDKLVELPTGGEVKVRSADNPDSLRGEGLDFAVLDECAFMKEAAWLEAIRPALSDRQGRAMFISTPKGHNWFWRLYQRGHDEHDTEWAAWTFPTSDNPYIADSEIEAAAGGLPERIYQQEYLAKFIDDAGGVFRRVMDAATAEPQAGRQMTGDNWHKYVFGVDWGQMNDFTVIAVIDIDTQELVHLDRFNQIDYVVQSGRLHALAERFKPLTIVAENNSMGQPIIERLIRDGLRVQPFQTTNATKMTAIDALALAFERGDIRILNDPVLVGELQAFEMNKTPSGLVKYAAPDGMHDDTVIALALAWQMAARKSSPFTIDQPTQKSKWAVNGNSNGGGSRWKF